jgi:hypothetical protein
MELGGKPYEVNRVSKQQLVLLTWQNKKIKKIVAHYTIYPEKHK